MKCGRKRSVFAASGYVVYLLRAVEPYKSSYKEQARDDSFRSYAFAVIPCAVLALLLNEANFESHWHGIGHYIMELAWAFSEYLEAVAIVPQLILLQRHRVAENITSYYVASLGAYRALYLCNWIYRCVLELNSHYITPCI
jgi:ER lumen protein retaining receptor